MKSFLDSLFSNPMTYLGVVFAFVAALAFLVFLRGFLSGLPAMFTLVSHDEHQKHHRVRVTWGVISLIALFIIWQLVRGVAGFFAT